MEIFLQAQGFDVWKAIVDEHKAPTTPPIDKDGKKLCENNSKDTNAILSGLASLCQGYALRLCKGYLGQTSNFLRRRCQSQRGQASNL
jgi:hypothetical protein